MDEHLKALVTTAFSGLAPDLGECDPSDAVQPVVDEILQRPGQVDPNLRSRLRRYDRETMDEVRGCIAAIIGE